MSYRNLLAGVFGAVSLLAQGPPPGGPGGPPPFGPGPGGPPDQVVTGVPFTGTETMQAQQTLADGTQISRSDTTKIYRDSSGRVRRDTTIQSRTMITIFDPVAGYVVRLDPSTSTAVKSALPSPPPTPPSGNPPQGPGTVTTTDLGSKTIAGLVATGTRTTMTIPAGAIGNSQAIQVVRDVWTSTQLEIPVLVTSTDPQRGTSTMQMTSATLGEPDASLFQIPASYTVSSRARVGRGPAQ